MDETSEYATPDVGSDHEESEYRGHNIRLIPMAAEKEDNGSNIKEEPTVSAEVKRGEVRIKMTAPGEETLDMVDRDPTRMNSHVKVAFEEVFAEPEGMHSFNPVWRYSYLTFFNTKFWCYRIITLICAVPASILWGFYFALLTFTHIWCVVPCVKATLIELQCVGQMFSLLVHTFLDPLFISFAKVFSNFHITMTRE